MAPPPNDQQSLVVFVYSPNLDRRRPLNKFIQLITPKYNHELRLASPAPAEYCMFWEAAPDKHGLITQSCLSQWWKANFIYNDEL